MPLSTQSQSDDEQYVLVASLDNARNLSNILKAIAFKDHAIFTATPNGLKVTVEDSKCLQANAFIQVCFFCAYVDEQAYAKLLNKLMLVKPYNIDTLMVLYSFLPGWDIPRVHHKRRSSSSSDQSHCSSWLS